MIFRKSMKNSNLHSTHWISCRAWRAAFTAGVFKYGVTLSGAQGFTPANWIIPTLCKSLSTSRERSNFLHYYYYYYYYFGKNYLFIFLTRMWKKRKFQKKFEKKKWRNSFFSHKMTFLKVCFTLVKAGRVVLLLAGGLQFKP